MLIATSFFIDGNIRDGPRERRRSGRISICGGKHRSSQPSSDPRRRRGRTRLCCNGISLRRLDSCLAELLYLIAVTAFFIRAQTLNGKSCRIDIYTALSIFCVNMELLNE